jgi:hypothetical protein
MKQDPDNIRHFCDVPHTALCGFDLAQGGSYERFHKNTTNCFADITCHGCQHAVYEQKLASGRFPPPPAWKNFVVDNTGGTK